MCKRARRRHKRKPLGSGHTTPAPLRRAHHLPRLLRLPAFLRTPVHHHLLRLLHLPARRRRATPARFLALTAARRLQTVGHRLPARLPTPARLHPHRRRHHLARRPASRARFRARTASRLQVDGRLRRQRHTASRPLSCRRVLAARRRPSLGARRAVELRRPAVSGCTPGTRLDLAHSLRTRRRLVRHHLAHSLPTTRGRLARRRLVHDRPVRTHTAAAAAAAASTASTETST